MSQTRKEIEFGQNKLVTKKSKNLLYALYILKKF